MEVFEDVAGGLKGHDLVVGNLENPLCKGGSPIPGKCTMRGGRAWAPILRKAGFNLLSLANNHIMDYGEEGLFSTIDCLQDAGLCWVGAGSNKKEACDPKYIETKGARWAFLGRSSVIVSSPCYAEEGRAGIAFLDLDETKQRIQECKSHADVVVLLVHWGLENYAYPTPEQRHVAKKLIESGADMVLGHHPMLFKGLNMLEKVLSPTAWAIFCLTNSNGTWPQLIMEA
jgi:poly-gamma-glutamate synthesis protein (capsule biosynthesis protein)